ncbi:MAG: CDP-diacylglycerol--serine O-phosphatidyltransferase, partial [Cytophagia bacterium]|nr:CDP-diacylglycerol--serine O-phosphatidyltransferase [Cytophagia bacterium]
MKKNIPNFFTIANLILGFLCIVNVFIKNDFEIIYVFYCCLILDFLDGFSARKLNLTSEFGKQIDSLADLVSFGVLPSVILYDYFDSNNFNLFLKYSSLLILVSSSIRLARFNLTEDNNYFFIGLPTPANALFFVSLIYYQGNLKDYFDENVILALIILFSFLMISNFKFISFKISR